MVGRQVDVPHTGDLTVGRFEVDRYLEWRQREGSAIAEGLFLCRSRDNGGQ